MSDAPVSLTSSGPPETVLDPEPSATRVRLAAAAELTGAAQRDAVAAAVADDPTSLEGWATLGDLGRDPIESYACYRVGYHRGLDRLRQSGWRGSGYVRWRHESNRGFLRSLDGLRAIAGEIGEGEEAERCAIFLRQLDPEWPPAGR
jgi:hypothetical protein